MDIKFLLENRHKVILEMYEPWPGTTVDGNKVDCHVSIRMSAHDAINYMRHRLYSAKKADKIPSDEELLYEFITVNWAIPVNINEVLLESE